MKSLMSLRASSKRFLHIVNKVVWQLDPFGVAKLHIASLIHREITSFDLHSLRLIDKECLPPIEDSEDLETPQMVQLTTKLSTNDKIQKLADFTDFIWGTATKLSISKYCYYICMHSNGVISSDVSRSCFMEEV